MRFSVPDGYKATSCVGYADSETAVFKGAGDTDFGIFFAYILTDSNASAIAVVSSAICPFGIISPGFKAFLRVFPGDIPTIFSQFIQITFGGNSFA